MKFLFTLTFIATIVGCTSAPKQPAGSSCTHNANEFRCVEIVSVYDGDTITVLLPGVHPLFGENTKVRVRGIDTPEIRTKNQCEKSAAKKAKALVVAKLNKARRVDLTNVSRGKYFRIVADVMVDGQSLSKALISAKLAYPYDGGTKSSVDWCKF